MRKYIHPYLKETMIQTKDGAIYLKTWLYFRTYLPLEMDYIHNPLWKKLKKEGKDNVGFLTENIFKEQILKVK